MLCIDGKLAGDTTLNNLLAASPTGWSHNIFHDEAPQDAQFPFVIFSRSSGVPTEAMGDPSAYETEIWMIKAVDRTSSADNVEAIAARVQTLLNDAALTISGATCLFLRRQSDVDYSEVADGISYRHSGSLFRLLSD